MHSFPSRGKDKRTKLQGLGKTGITRGMLGAAWGWAAFLTIASCQAKKIDWTLEAVEMSKKWKGLNAGNIHFNLSPPLILSVFILRSSRCFALLRFHSVFSILVSRLRFTVTQSFLSLSISGVLIVEYFYQRELKSHSTLVEWEFFLGGGHHKLTAQGH